MWGSHSLTYSNPNQLVSKQSLLTPITHPPIPVFSQIFPNPSCSSHPSILLWLISFQCNSICPSLSHSSHYKISCHAIKYVFATLLLKSLSLNLHFMYTLWLLRSILFSQSTLVFQPFCKGVSLSWLPIVFERRLVSKEDISCVFCLEL